MLIAVVRLITSAPNPSGLNTGKKGSLEVTVLPRLIRYRDAPSYVGMDRNRFNGEVRDSAHQK